MKVVRVLALTRYSALGASSRLRMLQYLPALHSGGIDVTVSPLLGDAYIRALYDGKGRLPSAVRGYARRLYTLCGARRYDAVWVEKECQPWVGAWLELGLLGRGTRLVADYDDALFHRYDHHSSPAVRRILGRKIDAVMRRANLVTVGNDYLGAHARAAGAERVEMLPTVVDLRRYPLWKPQRLRSEIVIGWIGSPSTAKYLQMLQEPLARLAQRHHIRCIAVGARADQTAGTPFEAVPWNEHMEVETIRNFDIGVMPLPDEPFERGKCGYKLIQYMACGLPVVASPVGANNGIVQPGVNGELVRTPGEWVDALERLACDAYMRQAMGQAGRRRVEQWYSLQVQAPRLLDFFRSVVASEGRGCSA